MNPLEQATISCPYCGESIVIVVDCSVMKQDYIEDCEVCCRPMRLQVAINASGLPEVFAGGEDK